MLEEDFVRHVIRPTLYRINLWSKEAECLLLGTALVESKLKHLVQIKGPALGVYQMEPVTHDDIYENYLRYRPDLLHAVRNMLVKSDGDSEFIVEQLKGNLYYATAMARIHYLRRPEALPVRSNWYAMAKYWKDHYNTHKGKGTVEKAERFFEEAYYICKETA